MRNARLDELQAGIKNAGRNTNNLRYVDGITLMAESKAWDFFGRNDAKAETPVLSPPHAKS